MNQSELENKIQLESEKYVLDLENRCGQSEFKKTVITFLKSKSHRLLLLESPHTSASAWKLLQVLMELQRVPELTVLNDYLGSQNQTTVKWGKLSEILQSSEAVPKLKNLLTCEFDDSVKLFLKDKARIRTIMEKLSYGDKGKIIFIISSKDNAFFKEIKSNSSIYFNGSENKIMHSYDNSAISLFGRISLGLVNATERILESGEDVNATDVNGTTALHEAAFNDRIDLALTLLRNGAKHLPDGNGDKPLHYAAKNGHVDFVNLFLENHVDVNMQGFSQRTALHYAAINNHTNLVLTLLKHGANHLPDGNGDTPLHCAAENGHEGVVKLFLENDVDVNMKGFNQRTALHYAAINNHTNLVLTLLKHGANHLPDRKGNTPLHCAAKNGHEEVVKLFFVSDVDVNIKGYDEKTALHYAAESGHKNVALILLKLGANHLPDRNGDTPLHCAAKNGHEEVVKLFLDNKVNVNIRGYDEQTALHYAAEFGHTNLVLTLLKNGANHLPDRNGDIPLHCAAANRHEEVVKLFLEKNVDVNIKGSTEQTALHYAAESGDTNLVLTLLKNGANHLPDRNGDTPLHCAAENGHEEVVKLFLENEGNVNIKGQGGMTALHHAVSKGYKGIIVTLVKKGADINLQNDEDKTALDLAQNRKDIIKILLENTSKELTQQI